MPAIRACFESICVERPFTRQTGWHSPGSALDLGSSGEAVRTLQRLLNSLGVRPALAVDGRYGARTEAAVRVVQQQLGLSMTGIVTVADRQRMQERLAERGAPPPTDIPRRLSAPGPAISELGTLAFARAIMRGGSVPPALASALGAPVSRTFAWPVPGAAPLESRLAGYTRHGALAHRPHKGVDIPAREGAPVVAVEDGVVLYTRRGWNGGYGNMVVLLHPDGSCTRYAHLQTIAGLDPGQHVSRGERIAAVGNTGLSHGAHLHFEVWQGGTWTDQRGRFSAETLRANGASDRVIAAMTGG